MKCTPLSNQTPKRLTLRNVKYAALQDRWLDRARTYEGIALAMAEQWGRLKELPGLFPE